MHSVTFALPLPTGPGEAAVAGALAGVTITALVWWCWRRAHAPGPVAAAARIDDERAKLLIAGYRSARWCVTAVPVAVIAVLAGGVYLAVTAPATLSGVSSAVVGAAVSGGTLTGTVAARRALRWLHRS